MRQVGYLQGSYQNAVQQNIKFLHIELQNLIALDAYQQIKTTFLGSVIFLDGKWWNQGHVTVHA